MPSDRSHIGTKKQSSPMFVGKRNLVWNLKWSLRPGVRRILSPTHFPGPSCASSSPSPPTSCSLYSRQTSWLPSHRTSLRCSSSGLWACQSLTQNGFTSHGNLPHPSFYLTVRASIIHDPAYVRPPPLLFLGPFNEAFLVSRAGSKLPSAERVAVSSLPTSTRWPSWAWKCFSTRPAPASSPLPDGESLGCL